MCDERVMVSTAEGAAYARRRSGLAGVLMAVVMACCCVFGSWPLCVAASDSGTHCGAVATWLLAASGQSGQDNMQEWQKLSPAEKEQYRRRMDQLKRMPPADRQQFNRMFNAWQQLSPDEQRQLQQALDQWDSLPESQKQEIRSRFGK